MWLQIKVANLDLPRLLSKPMFTNEFKKPKCPRKSKKESQVHLNSKVGFKVSLSFLMVTARIIWRWFMTKGESDDLPNSLPPRKSVYQLRPLKQMN